MITPGLKHSLDPTDRWSAGANPVEAVFSGHSPRTLRSWVKAWGGFEESVEPAGDVADQAGSDLAVGRALSPPPLGISAGRWVIAQPGQDDQVQGLVELFDS